MGYSDLFEKSYQTLLEGFEYQRFAPHPGGRTKDRARLIKWLRGLPKPVALVVWDTNLGREVILACLSASFQIPDQIAVLCVEADPLISSLCPVPLSYIDQDGDAVGYQAASVLESMMFGEPPPAAPILIPPIHVVERISTDAVAVCDPLVASIMQYIRNRASSPIAVADLEREFDLSRRQLEYRFLNELGHSPAAEIRRARLALVKDLLRKTNLTLEKVAARSGFQDASVLIRSFQRDVGQTPGEFRKSPRTVARAETPEK